MAPSQEQNNQAISTKLPDNKLANPVGTIAKELGNTIAEVAKIIKLPQRIADSKEPASNAASNQKSNQNPPVNDEPSIVPINSLGNGLKSSEENFNIKQFLIEYVLELKNTVKEPFQYLYSKASPYIAKITDTLGKLWSSTIAYYAENNPYAMPRSYWEKREGGEQEKGQTVLAANGGTSVYSLSDDKAITSIKTILDSNKNKSIDEQVALLTQVFPDESGIRKAIMRELEESMGVNNQGRFVVSQIERLNTAQLLTALRSRWIGDPEEVARQILGVGYV